LIRTPIEIFKTLCTWSRKVLSVVLFSSGVALVLALIISFTSWPYWGVYHLGHYQSEYQFEPEYIVVMGGSGVPSATALIRTYHAAVIAQKHPQAKVVIALPGNLLDSLSDIKKMEAEMIRRGVQNDFKFEFEGTNTRSQALKIKAEIITNPNAPILIVSSPEHMYRCIKVFRKLGYRNLASWPAFEQDLTDELLYDNSELGGNQFVPNVGNSKQFRYQFWNHLKYEIDLLREYFAIAYYYINNWI